MTSTNNVLPTLVMLSGHLCNEKLWEKQIEHFSGKYRCIPMVFRHGDSIANFAEQTLKAAPEKFSLIGLSMGGYVAFEMMRRAPERVERLALLDTSAEAETPERTAQRYIDRKTADELGIDKFAECLPARWVEATRAKDPKWTERLVEMVTSVGVQAQKQQQEAIIHRVDSFDTLATIKCPTLILCGREDAATPLAMHEDMACAMPHATFVVIENCGHLSTMEQPEKVNQALDNWLS